MSYLIYDGVNLTETYGLTISGLETHRGPERDIETVSIPGRDGDLHFDNGRYLNYLQPYSCFIRDEFASKVPALRRFLCERQAKYFKLEDGYHTDEFRLARFVGPFEPEVGTNNNSATFTIEFDCKPYRFLNRGINEKRYEIEYTSSSVITTGDTLITNNTDFDSWPEITVSTTISNVGCSVLIEKGETAQDRLRNEAIQVIVDSKGAKFYFDSENNIVLKGSSNSFKNVTFRKRTYVNESTQTWADVTDVSKMTLPVFEAGKTYNVVPSAVYYSDSGQYGKIEMAIKPNWRRL